MYYILLGDDLQVFEVGWLLSQYPDLCLTWYILFLIQAKILPGPQQNFQSETNCSWKQYIDSKSATGTNNCVFISFLSHKDRENSGFQIEDTNKN